MQNQHHDEVTQYNNHHGDPDDDAIAAPQVQGHQKCANGRLDEEHSVDVQSLRYEDDVHLVGEPAWLQPPWVCLQSALTTFGGENAVWHRSKKIENLLTVSKHVAA